MVQELFEMQGNLNFRYCKSGKPSSRALGDYVRWQLNADTIGMDSVILALANSSKSNDHIRMIAAMARQGDTTFGTKSLRKKLGTAVNDYIAFTADLRKGGGKALSAASEDLDSPYYIWARVHEKRTKNAELPSPVELPQKRIGLSEEEEYAQLLTIFPNPANEEITLLLEGEVAVEIQIFDLKGSRVHRTAMSAKNNCQRISVSKYVDGLYVIKVIINGKEVKTEKFEVQH